MNKAVVFCPVTCLRRLVIQRDQHSEMLNGCFYFDTEVKPGWIEYDPEKITVLSCNDSFCPIDQVNAIVDAKKQIVSLKTEADLRELTNILEKPVLMCVTRRHHCLNAKTLLLESEKNLSLLNPVQRELSRINGFDIDFAVIFPPGVLREKIDESLRNMRRNIDASKKYCIRVDIEQIMRELTPTQLQKEASLEFVSWHNTAFWLTNHCKPHHSLMYINGFIFWVVLFPFSLFVALPYRLTRRMFCADSHIDLKTALKFTADAKDTVAVYVWFTEKPIPGAYRKHGKHFSVRATTVAELKPFVQDCNIVSFNFEETEVTIA